MPRITQDESRPVPATAEAVCQLWHLQAVLTAAQWSALQNAVQSLNNQAVTAFFSHPGNSIPANSATAIQLGAAISLTAAQVAALVQQASQVSIP